MLFFKLFKYGVGSHGGYFMVLFNGSATNPYGTYNFSLFVFNRNSARKRNESVVCKFNIINNTPGLGKLT